MPGLRAPGLLRLLAIGMLATVAALGLFRWIGPAAGLEASLADRVRLAFGPVVATQHPEISLITIDEATMATLPYRSPVDRGLLADIVKLVGAAGARAVALDILLDQPTEPEKDARLATALAEFPGRAVIAWADGRAGMTDAQSDWLTGFLDASGAEPGFANLVQDPDGIVRHHVGALEGTDVAGFAAALSDKRTPSGAAETGRIDWLVPEKLGGIVFQRTPAHVIPLMAANHQILKGWYENRIVLIGADLPQQDRHATPLTTVLGSADTAGVVIHAHLLAQLLEDRSLPQLKGWLNVAWVLLAALSACAMAVVPAWILVRCVLLLGLAGGILGGVVLVLEVTGAVPPIVPTLLAAGLAAAAAMGLDAVQAHRSRRFVRNAFSHYLAPELVDVLVREPETLRLGGERRHMTFLFTDIAGFTGMSERLEAEALADLLNAYLEGVSAIVMRQGGVIDKYIGDAVVALFGVPHDDPSHAAKAICCAAEIDRFAEQFREAHAASGLGVTRIGIHTGEAVVGNFGGNARFDYTAIGDAMNTAARLEGANKAFGTRVCFSGACRDAAATELAEPLPVHPVGDVLLKGKTEPLPVFALRPEHDAAWIARFQRAYAMLGDDSSGARFAFEDLAQDPVATLHLDRLERGEKGTVFQLTEK